ncbi:leucine-rich repeat domain-containing protein [Thiofilum sp.]|uniref:leucine-rich repeat domain-containing protein n=1 Tax=Thiofilum sp. TaxID=2212733 RepID=UPI0025F86271|nr:leucine-rich repeat domain-containing protein [Thiofilum sp.]
MALDKTLKEMALERIEECRRTRSPKLDLSELDLAEIPEMVFELEWLEELDVSGDWESRGSLRSIPAQIAQLTQLTTLTISFNQFNDLGWLQYVPHLQSLDCSFNPLTALQGLEHTPHLQSLDCSYNQLTSLQGLVHTPQLQSLDCSSNQLTSLQGLVTLPLLQSLHCGGNQLTSLQGLVHTPQLQSLDCSYNQLTSLQGLVHTPQLQSLHCGGNQLTSLQGLVTLPLLQSLHCGGNQLTSLQGLVHTPQLQSLDCSYNQLTSLQGLVHTPQLQSLHCGGNQLTSLQGLVHTPQLQSLDCSYNQLTSLQGLVHTPQLQSLDCSYNQLTSLQGLVHTPQLQSLHCGGNQLTSLQGLVHTPQLQSLDCSYNQLTSLQGLVHTPQLQSLHCGGNQLTSLQGLVTLPLLQSLDCNNNQLTSLQGLVTLPLLQSLDCSNNQLTSLQGLVTLPLLQSLHCNNNQLTSLQGLVTLPLLQSLHCNNNQLTSLQGLVTLPLLQSLHCNNNQLTSLQGLVTLPLLQSLDCSYNQLTSLQGLVTLPLLQSLDCDHNQLTSLQDLEHTPQLQFLFCYNNQLTSIEPLQTLGLINQLKSLSLYSNPIKHIPPAIFGSNYPDDCLKSLKHYWQDLAQGATRVQQLKVQLVGNGRVGKSTLAYTLEHKKAPTEHFSSTHGIVIKNIDLPVEGLDQPVTLNLWDFGGQEIYHATHRLFLSSDCVYLLLWAEDTEEHENEIRHPISYWLESINDLGKKCPVILVKNQIDKADQGGVSPPELTSDCVGYDQIKNEVKISAYQYIGLNTLRGALADIIRELAYKVCLDLPDSWLAVQDELERLRPKKTIPFAHFEQLCIKHGVSDATWFLKYLHDTGVLFYSKGNFQDQIILDQNWAIEAVYKVFDPNDKFRARIKRASGLLTPDDIKDIWHQEDEAKRETYLEFMKSCQIGYVKNYDYRNPKPLSQYEFIIPALLPETTSAKAIWGNDQAHDWLLTVHYSFLHRSIIERLIIKLGEHYQDQSSPWLHGTHCITPHGQLLMEAVIDNAKLSNKGKVIFKLRGQQLNALVLELRQLIKNISPHNRYEEYLTQQGKTKPLPELEESEEITEQETMDKKIKIFISYSHEDEKYLTELKKRLKIIGYDIPNEPWSDHNLLAGSSVHDVIYQELKTADIVILLISPDFMASDYCFNHEVDIALEQYHNEQNIVVPIIIRNTPHWTKCKIGKITAIPKFGTPLKDYKDPDDFWGEVQTQLQRTMQNLIDKA